MKTVFGFVFYTTEPEAEAARLRGEKVTLLSSGRWLSIPSDCYGE